MTRPNAEAIFNHHDNESGDLRLRTETLCDLSRDSVSGVCTPPVQRCHTYNLGNPSKVVLMTNQQDNEQQDPSGKQARYEAERK